MQIFWFIPTHGDSRYLGTARGGRPVHHDYVKQVAIAADSLGYEGVLIPTGRSCEDPWVVASSLIGFTRRLKFLVAVRPGLHQPSLAARMAASYGLLLHEMLAEVADEAGMGQHFGAGFTEIEARWMRDRAWARTPADCLMRRSKICQHMADKQEDAFTIFWENSVKTR